MKVLIIANEYYPYPSAITNAFKPIIDEMLNNKYQVDFITKMQNINMSTHEKTKGVNVYRIEDWFYNSYNITDTQRKYNGYFFMNIANKLSILLMRGARFLDYIIDTKIYKNQDGFINKKLAIKLARKLHKENKYDCIISLSYPFVMNEIAYEIKKYDSKVKWYAYQFDPYTFNTTLDKKNYKLRLKKEIKILNKADKIFLPEENFKQNMKTELSVLKEKYIQFPYALVEKNNKLIKKEKNNKRECINFVYTGTLYKNIREPNKTLDFFYILREKKISYKLDFYYRTVPELEKTLQEYKEKLGDNLVLHKEESKEICDQASYNADVLINIGNTTSNQTPSKVFENISMCKPIVNFYSIDEDTTKNQLKKYEISLNIDTRKEYTGKIIEKFIDFCLENKEKEVSFEEATKNFLKSHEVAKKFIQIIGENNAEN